MSNIIISRLGRKIEYEPKKAGSIFSFSFFNIKSNEITDIIKHDKFKKIIDLIDENTSLLDSSINATARNEISKNIEKLLLNSKLSVSSKNINIKKVNKILDVNNEETQLSNNLLIPKEAKSIEINKLIGDNDKFNVDNDYHFNTLNNSNNSCNNDAVDTFDDGFITKRVSTKLKFNSYTRSPTLKKSATDRDFLFDDIVFDFYKIHKSDSIYQKSKDLDIITSPLVKNIIIDQGTNKFSDLFNEISSIFRVHYENEDFLKIYENFKPYLKFFHSCLREAVNITSSFENQGISKKALDENNNIKRILIVDDNKPILKALKNVTSIAIKDLNLTNKLEIIKAYDGVDALALFKIEHYTSQSIKYIISDHNMSMMDGCLFIKLVNDYKLCRDIKLYISSTDNEIIKSNNIKNVKFINKPVRKSDIKTLLSSFVA